MMVHHLFFEMAFNLNTIIVVVYWTFLHEGALKRPEVLADWRKGVFMYIVHIVPAASFYLNWLMSDIIMLKRHLVWYYIPAVGYFYINYCETLSRGEPLYPEIMDWINDFVGAVKSCACILAVFSCVYILQV